MYEALCKKSNKTDRFNNKVKSLRKKQDIASYPMIYYALKKISNNLSFIQSCALLTELPIVKSIYNLWECDAPVNQGTYDRKDKLFLSAKANELIVPK